MDLSQQHGFTAPASRPRDGDRLVAGVLDLAAVRELLTSPDVPRDVLAFALEESLRRFESLLSCTSGTFYCYDFADEPAMSFAGMSIKQLTGYPPEYFQTTPYSSLIVADDHQVVGDIVAQAIAKQTYFDTSYRIRHRCGEVRWISTHGKAHYDDAGKPQFIEGFLSDVTEQKQLEQALISQADGLRTTLDSIPDMVWTATSAGKGEYYNKAWNEFIGRSQSTLRREGHVSAEDWIHPEDRKRLMREWRQSLKTGKRLEQELRLRHHSGDYRWIMARAAPQTDERGNIVKWYGTATDVHERVIADRKLQKSRRLQNGILRASPDYIKVMDLEGRLILINDPVFGEDLLAHSSQLVGKLWTDLWPKRDRPKIRRAIRSAGNGKVVRFSRAGSTSRGDVMWWDILLSPIADAEGKITNLLCISRDVTALKSATERLRIASEQDFLTSLPNRRAFEKRLKKAISRARERGTSVGLMLIDLDHFKHVNDTLGHLAGDRLLCAIGKRLQNCVPENGFVARLGGDEFAIMLGDVHDEMELVAAVTRIHSQMERPILFQGKDINGGLSVGCALYPRDAVDEHELLRHADTALYDLKSSGRGGIQMFNSQLKDAAERTLTQLNLARRVIRDDVVEPYYQPKVHLDSARVSGFEALLRWWCPASGIQSPATVAEAFNDYELSSKIGGLMQKRVLADMASWLDAGLRVLPVSINAAPAEFLRDDYAERLLHRIAEHHISPSLIEVEITEHAFVERHPEHVVRALRMLKDAGVRIALDDFGTGHSSLSHLRDFPVDVIKIDCSFVNRMLVDPSMLAIVRAVVKLGPDLSLDVVAEGIETLEQLQTLRSAGCGYGQGYLFGKAMDARAAAGWIAMSGPLSHIETAADRHGEEDRLVGSIGA